MRRFNRKWTKKVIQLRIKLKQPETSKIYRFLLHRININGRFLNDPTREIKLIKYTSTTMFSFQMNLDRANSIKNYSFCDGSSTIHHVTASIFCDT